MRYETTLLNEINLVLAEKRTQLSVMRTGLAVLALPVSVFSVLVVISRYYDPMGVIYLLLPLLGLCAALTVLGSYLIIKSIRCITRLNEVVSGLKNQTDNLRDFRPAKDDIVRRDDDA